jgi:hypothetical protein
MSEVTINNVTYNTDDRIVYCRKCGGYYYDAPELMHRFKLTEEQRRLWLESLMGAAYCPKCNDVQIWVGTDKVVRWA